MVKSMERILRNRRQLHWKLQEMKSDESTMNQDPKSVMLKALFYILNLTKAHLDACLATTKVILEENVDPG